jgi:hypothetical protein
MEAEDVDGDADDINSSDSDGEHDPTEASIPNSWNRDFPTILRVNKGCNH